MPREQRQPDRGEQLRTEPQRQRGGQRQAAKPKKTAVEEFAVLVDALADTWADRLWDAGRDDLSADLRTLALDARHASQDDATRGQG